MMIERKLLSRIIGAVGFATCVLAFALRPSFPTPDKLFIFLLFIFMAYSQAWQLFKKLFPFVSVILIYESFRSFADRLNTHVNYLFAPHADKLLFGKLPTIYLQDRLWKGHTSWYDYVLYIPYLFHFVIPFGLAILIWKSRESEYNRALATYLVVAFAAFLTFFIFPAAPPWLASQNHYIQPISRISSQVWAGLGLKDFPSVYNHIAPNPVAAIPSLHAAWAVLFLIFVWKLYGRRWGILSAGYPFLIFMGTIYEGEHYAFDVIAGIIYAIAGYVMTPWLMRHWVSAWKRIKAKYSSSTKTVLKLAQ
ncbi:MAG TPA: phosphatase PAP2 family protein [Candidatus Saccharimonadales bacterium]|nr:phosphatase PAP2 family protein [Candidatus Saccharimonadales bacterium]